jgi:hypothetical protein
MKHEIKQLQWTIQTSREIFWFLGEVSFLQDLNNLKDKKKNKYIILKKKKKKKYNY